eukprot:2264408-Prymnesium_polylepis.1
MPPVCPRATGVEPPGISGPHMDPNEAKRKRSTSNKVGVAAGGAATDEASTAQWVEYLGVTAPAALRAAAVSCGCSGRPAGLIRLPSSGRSRHGRRRLAVGVGAIESLRARGATCKT